MPLSENQKIINKLASAVTKINAGRRVIIGNAREIFKDLAGMLAMNPVYKKAWDEYCKKQVYQVKPTTKKKKL